MTSSFYSIFLGLVQGLTEFLPISSSGHLVIMQRIIPGFSQPGVLLDVFLHLGTTLAVIFYFRKTILTFLKEKLLFIIISSIPAALIGVIFGGFLENLFDSIRIVSVALLVTSILNLKTSQIKSKNIAINSKNAFVIGIFQAIAIIPGISRSGSTIFSGSLMGFSKKKAAEFSFIISIPAVIGATLYQFVKYFGSIQGNYLTMSLGFLSSFLFGYMAINMVLRLVTSNKYIYFSIYCATLGLITLLL